MAEGDFNTELLGVFEGLQKHFGQVARRIQEFMAFYYPRNGHKYHFLGLGECFYDQKQTHSPLTVVFLGEFIGPTGEVKLHRMVLSVEPFWTSEERWREWMAHRKEIRELSARAGRRCNTDAELEG